MSLFSNELSTFMACAICLEKICNNPVTTSFCAHTFCRDCLTQHIYKSSSQSKAKQGKARTSKAEATLYQCPSCTSPNVLPPGGVSCLRVNKPMEALAKMCVEESITILSMNNNSTAGACTATVSTFRESVLCCQCISCNLKVDAQLHCKACSKAVCISCFLQSHAGHFACSVEEGTNLLIDAYKKRLFELDEEKQVLLSKISEISANGTTVIQDVSEEALLIDNTIQLCDMLLEKISAMKLQAVTDQIAFMALQSRSLEEHLVLLAAELAQNERRSAEVSGIIERSAALEMSSLFNAYCKQNDDYEYVTCVKIVRRELSSEANLTLNKIKDMSEFLQESIYEDLTIMETSAEASSESRAEHLLLSPHVKSGQYIQQMISDKHVLSVRYENEESACPAVKHYEITVMQDRRGVYLEENAVFFTMHDLLEHYKVYQGSLCCLLTSPFKTVQQRSLEAIEIPRKCIVIEREIASTDHSVVYRGKMNSLINVAVKQAKINAEKSSVVHEAQMMLRLDHERIVHILAICTSENPTLLVLEYMANGCLLEKLQQLQRLPIGQCPEGWNTLLTRAKTHAGIVSQVAMAMSYLQEKRIVHRDLRAANVLLDEKDNAKLSDFELSIEVVDDYFTSGSSKTPIRWTAPEVIFDRRFSSKSDVWSFGVFVHEVVTMGARPYATMSNQEVTEFVRNGYYMVNPHNSTSVYCPLVLYQMLLQTWNLKPEERPGFDALVKLDFASLMADLNCDASSDKPENVKRTIDKIPIDEENDCYKPEKIKRKLHRSPAFRRVKTKK